MIFRITVLLLAFIIPFGAYYIYLRLYFSKNLKTQYQRVFLSLAFIIAFTLSAIYFIYLSQSGSNNIHGKFIPTIIDANGTIIQSHIE